MKTVYLPSGMLLLFVTAAAVAQSPSILSLGSNGLLSWTGGETNGLIAIESRGDLAAGAWSPYFYALGRESVSVKLYSVERGYFTTDYTDAFSHNVRFTQLPTLSSEQQFYRIAMRTNFLDPSLVVHLSFDNDFSNGVIIDASGHGNHALQYSPTNWPAAATGPDGSRAGAFSGPRTWPGNPHFMQGDYAGIPYSPTFDHLSNGTVLAWAYHDVTSYNNSTIVDNSSYGTQRGSWSLGRSYSNYSLFEIGIGGGQNATYVALQYPDYASGGTATGAWHYYGATWDGTNIVGYFDGQPFSTNSQVGFPELVVGRANWMAIGCKVHDGTPQWGDPDGYPNWGWLGGRIDDVRVYNRALTAREILDLYGSFDKQAPSTPENVSVKPDSASQAELRWDPALDNFRVDGYHILRDGAMIGTTSGPGCYVDTDLSAATTYIYTVQAFDPGGNLSPESELAVVTTLAAGGPVDVIVDDTDGPPWVTITGGPWTGSVTGAYADCFGRDALKGNSTTTGSVEFRPNLPEAGNYQLYMWHPANGSGSQFSAQAPIDVVVSGTTNTVYVNEQKNYGKWDPMGTFACDAGTNTVVRVRPAPNAASTPADAVRFVK